MTSERLRISPRLLSWIPVLPAGGYALLLSVPRHWRMESTGFDLGIFEQGVRGYAALQAAPVATLKGSGFPLLGDHFSPLLAVLAPLYRLFPGATTLLVAQALLFALSCVPVTGLAVELLGRMRGLAVGSAYGLSWGLWRASSFDFHEVALAVPLAAGAVAALARGRYRAAVGWALPLLLVKEDQGLVVAGIGLYVWWRGRRRLGAATVLAAVAVTLLAVLAVVPAMNPGGAYDYGANGAWHGNPVTRLLLPAVKWHTVAALLAPTLFVALRSPLSLLLVLPLAGRFWTPSPTYWDTAYHYNAVLMPVLFVALADGLHRLAGGRDRVSDGSAGRDRARRDRAARALRYAARGVPAAALAFALTGTVTEKALMTSSSRFSRRDPTTTNDACRDSRHSAGAGASSATTVVTGTRGRRARTAAAARSRARSPSSRKALWERPASNERSPRADGGIACTSLNGSPSRSASSAAQATAMGSAEAASTPRTIGPRGRADVMAPPRIRWPDTAARPCSHARHGGARPRGPVVPAPAAPDRTGGALRFSGLSRSAQAPPGRRPHGGSGADRPAGPAEEAVMMYWNDHGMTGWGVGLMTVSMLLFWALLIFGVVALVRHVGQASRHSPAPPPAAVPPERPAPEQLLAERLARGEIEPDEYRRRLDVLRGSPPTAG